MGTSWVYPITKYICKLNEQSQNDSSSSSSSCQEKLSKNLTLANSHVNYVEYQNFVCFIEAVIDESFFIRTSRGIIPRSILKPINSDGSTNDILPTDTGE